MILGLVESEHFKTSLLLWFFRLVKDLFSFSKGVKDLERLDVTISYMN